MSWARLDDHANEHPKLLAAGGEACWLWACGLMYANRQKARNGFIPDAMVPALFPVLKNPRRLAAKLVDVGLWEKTKGGFQIHDYHVINSTAEQHEAKKEAGRLRAAKSYGNRKVRGLLGPGSSPDSSDDSSPDSSPISSREEPERRDRDSSGVEWSGSGSGDLVGDQSGSTPPDSARGESLVSRAKAWLADPNRASLVHPNPESWPETLRHVEKLREVFGGPAQKPRTSADPRVQVLLGRWAEGYSPAELDQAIAGAKHDANIATHQQYQTLTTILRDAAQVDRFTRLLTVKPTAPVKTNPRTVQPGHGEDPYTGAEVVSQ